MKIPTLLSVYSVLSLLAFNCYGGAKLPVNANGEVVYSQSYKLAEGFKDEDAYALAQKWFCAEPSKFVSQRGNGLNVNCKNKAFVEQEFTSGQALQSLDPASGRMTGRGLIKYFGESTSSISLLYMEYYIVVEIHNHQLTATIGSIKYHHYNQRTYTEKPIYGWQGGKPFDSSDRLENLINSPTENKDIENLGIYVNNNITSLFTNLQSYLSSQKALNSNHITAGIAK